MSIDGGLPEPLPVDQGGLTSFSPDGTKIAYNPIFRNFRTWKRYTGGLAQAISIYDLKNNTVEDVPHTDWTDTFPMWHGNTIYFTSDRGAEHHLNLYSYDLSSKQIEQLTHFTDFDVMWPSLGPDSIVFENGGYLYTFDLQSKQPKKLTISLPGDRDQSIKHWASVSQKHHRLRYFAGREARGIRRPRRCFHRPRERGQHSQPDSHSRHSREIGGLVARRPLDRLRLRPQRRRRTLHLAPGRNGQRAADHQRIQRLQVRPRVVARQQEAGLVRQGLPPLVCRHQREETGAKSIAGKYGEILNYSWSPDSKWLAYDKNAENSYSVVHLYSLADSKITPVTTSMTNSFAPVFDPDGKYLYFLSDRDFNEVLGQC